MRFTIFNEIVVKRNSVEYILIFLLRIYVMYKYKCLYNIMLYIVYVL
jgi:hypothetical protein